MIAGRSYEPAGRAAAMRDALSYLEDADRYRDLHRGVAVTAFCLSAGFAVYAFFLIGRLGIWVGADEHAAFLRVSMSWVLIFPIWVLAFSVVMSALHAMGIRDLRAAVRSRLANLAFGPDQLRELRAALASRRWRHGPAFKAVIDDLAKVR